MVGRCTATTFLDASLFWLDFYFLAIKPELPMNCGLFWRITPIMNLVAHSLWASVGTCCWIDATDAAPCRGKSPTAGRLCQEPTDWCYSEGERKSFWIFLGQFQVFSVTACLCIFSVCMFTPVFRFNELSYWFGWLIHLLLLSPVSRPYKCWH